MKKYKFQLNEKKIKIFQQVFNQGFTPKKVWYFN
jgi:hypothetical protein